MGLKITTQIGTDKGITSEAYVRIADYQVNKNGSANFRLELFQSQDDSIQSLTGPSPMPFMPQARNQQIGEFLSVPLTKEIEKTRTIKKNVEVDVDATEEAPAHKTWVMKDVEEKYTTVVPDLTPLEDIDIFEFAYSRLKAKLEGLFGANSVIDC
jgi:hypothetical protein